MTRYGLTQAAAAVGVMLFAFGASAQTTTANVFQQSSTVPAPSTTSYIPCYPIPAATGNPIPSTTAAAVAGTTMSKVVFGTTTPFVTSSSVYVPCVPISSGPNPSYAVSTTYVPVTTARPVVTKSTTAAVNEPVPVPRPTTATTTVELGVYSPLNKDALYRAIYFELFGVYPSTTSRGFSAMATVKSTKIDVTCANADDFGNFACEVKITVVLTGASDSTANPSLPSISASEIIANTEKLVQNAENKQLALKNPDTGATVAVEVTKVKSATEVKVISGSNVASLLATTTVIISTLAAIFVL